MVLSAALSSSFFSNEVCAHININFAVSGSPSAALGYVGMRKHGNSRSRRSSEQTQFSDCPAISFCRASALDTDGKLELIYDPRSSLTSQISGSASATRLTLCTPCKVFPSLLVSLSLEKCFNTLKLRSGKLLERRNPLGLKGSIVSRNAYQTLRVHASSTDFPPEGFGEKDGTSQPMENKVEDYRNAAVDKQKGSLQLVRTVAAFASVVMLVAIAVTLDSGRRAALVEATAKSGFTAAFALIFVSEIGDKTFFIAALLAMQHSRSMVLLGSCGALALMSVISVVIGRIFHAVPTQLKTTLPIGEYAAVALLLYFGFKSMKHAWDLPSGSPKNQGEEPTEMGELAEAEEFVRKAEVKKTSTPIEILGETFSLVFVAEWGDRSMLATIALGAAQSPWGVATGAIAGHVVATGLAVIGGAFLARYISEKVVGYISGFLFLGFAAATLMGVF